MADPKLRVFWLGTIFLSCFGSIVLETNGANSQIVTVSRRLTGDSITFSSGDRILCNIDDNLTYLVSERQCVRNQGLLNGCIFSIAPSQQHSNITLTILIRTTNQQETLLMTPEEGSILTEAVVVHRTTTHQSVNSSSCSISSLEVYRGKQQTFEIAHDGWSLTDSGTIKLNVHQIEYRLEDLEGELYRMNLSCSGGRSRQLESGCLFFKVIGMTNVTKAKFNESVSGSNIRDMDIPTTLSNGSTSSSYSHTTLHTTGTSNMTLNPSDQASGPDLFIYIIVAATGIVALLFVVVLLCMILVYCCSVDKKRNHGQGSGVTVATNLWFEQRDLLVLNNPPGPPYDANTLETVQ